jgi:hypothetical protein
MNVGLFKVLGGVALGVGAVAAAPFTGGGSILGAASLMGSLAGAGAVAAGVGAVGGVAGAFASKSDKEKIDAARQESYEHGLIKGNDETLKKFTAILEDVKRGNNFLVASAAVGFCVAASDGDFSEEEQYEINCFIGDVDKNPNIPVAVKNTIKQLNQKAELGKIDFDEIKKYFEPLNKDEMVILKKFANDIINVDFYESPEEFDFKNDLDEYINAR